MDREAAVIRAEMNQTRAQLDRKIGLLEERARAYSPRQLSDRYLPDFLAEKVLGSLLTLVGVKMAYAGWRAHNNRRRRIRAAVEAYGRW
jgi:hypothetical protein